jgi:hypothetical protein
LILKTIILSIIFLANVALAQEAVPVKVKSIGVGVHFTTFFNGNFLKASLPNGLSLDPARFRPDGSYPVLVWTGGQLNYRAGVGIGGGIGIERLFAGNQFSVPVTGQDGYDYLFVLQADVGNVKVHEFERIFLEWNKNFVFANWDNTDYTASEPDLTRLYRAEFDYKKDFDKENFRKNLNVLKIELSKPFIIPHKQNSFLCFQQNWLWNDVGNRYRSTGVKMVISKAAFNGQAEGVYTSPALDQSTEGGIKVVAQWKMREGFTCNLKN